MDFADKFRRNIGAPRTYRIGHGQDAQDFVFKPIPASFFGDQMVLQKALARAFAGASKLSALYEAGPDGQSIIKAGVTDEQMKAAFKEASDTDLDGEEYALALKLLFAMVRNSYPQHSYQITDEEVEMFCTANFQQLLFAFLDLNTNVKYAAEDLSKIKAMKEKVNQGEAAKA